MVLLIARETQKCTGVRTQSKYKNSTTQMILPPSFLYQTHRPESQGHSQTQHKPLNNGRRRLQAAHLRQMSPAPRFQGSIHGRTKSRKQTNIGCPGRRRLCGVGEGQQQRQLLFHFGSGYNDWKTRPRTSAACDRRDEVGRQQDNRLCFWNS